MIEELKKYQRTIKKKYSFGWTPKYEDEFRTALNKTVFIPIAIMTIEKLGWDLVYQDESSIEVIKGPQYFHWGQNISVKFAYGKVTVKSESRRSPLFDFGRNSLRVNLFIHAFHQTTNEFDKASLNKLEEEIKRGHNWDDYEIPEKLPQPKIDVRPKMWIPILGGLLLSIILGFLIAYLTIKVMYMAGFFEVGVGIIIAFGFKYLMKASNYTNFKILSYLLIGVVLITYVLNQYFFYGLMVSENNIDPIGFVEFIKSRFREGLEIEYLNAGWMELVIAWIFQVGVTYASSYLLLGVHFLKHQSERIPMEVVGFTVYHFIEGKSEEEVRSELSKMGWTKKEDQDAVFELIGGIEGMQD